MSNDFLLLLFFLARMHCYDIHVTPQNWPQRNRHVITYNAAFFLPLRTETTLEIWLQESINDAQFWSSRVAKK